MTEQPNDQPPERAPPQQVFLPRETYRQRRLQDAVQLVPIAGLVLFILPIFWIGAGWSLTTVTVYLFGVWAVLIAVSAALIWVLKSDTVPEPDNGAERSRKGRAGAERGDGS